MNKMNKKGFTLIEMLVVIAIIAVLVSIIIPVVGNSTKKAAAATDAANLRAAKAQISIAVLEGVQAKDVLGATTMPAGYGTAPACKSNSADTFKFDVNADGNVTVYFGSNTISYYANIAGGGTDAQPTTCTKTLKDNADGTAGGVCGATLEDGVCPNAANHKS